MVDEKKYKNVRVWYESKNKNFRVERTEDETGSGGWQRVDSSDQIPSGEVLEQATIQLIKTNPCYIVVRVGGIPYLIEVPCPQ